MNQGKLFPFRHVLLVGLGVMGGSYLKKLQQFPEVTIDVLDPSDEPIKQAQDEGNRFTRVTLEDTARLAHADLVIITLYPRQVVPFMRQLVGKVAANCLVTDISGIKSGIADALRAEQWPFAIILGHPMAGRENGGYAYADAQIFAGANFLYLADALSASEQQEADFITGMRLLGFAHVNKVPAIQHDRAVTYTSQLTHVIALSLLNSSDYSEQTRFAIGDSFRDLTRIAKVNTPLWAALFEQNSTELIRSIDAFQEQLELMKTYLAGEQAVELRDFLNQARARRIAIETKEELS